MVYKLYKRYENIINYIIDFIMATSIYIQFDLSSFFFVLFFILIIIVRKRINIKYKKSVSFFSFLIMFTTIIGDSAFNHGSVFYLFNNGWRALHTCYFGVAFWYLAYIATYYVFEFVSIVENKSTKRLKIFDCKHIFWLTWIITFISKIPYWMAYYPGYFCYDMHVQTFEMLGYTDISSYQPPIHTLYWLGIHNLANVIHVNAICLYEFCQVLFITCIFTYLIMYLIRKRVSNWIIIFAYVWLIINPVISIFTLATTKDIIFGGLLIIFMINYIDCLSNIKYLKNIKWVIKMTFIVVLLCLFRNNFIYAFVVFLLFMFLFCKKYRKNILIVGLIPVVIHFFIITLGYSALGITNGMVQEKLSVPIQQIAYSVIKHRDEMTDEEMSLLDYFFTTQGYNDYRYRISDPVKGDMDTNILDSNLNSFFELWANMLVKYPDEYITAFVNLNMPSWYISNLNMMDNYDATYFDRKTYDLIYYRVNYDTKFFKLLKLCDKFSNFKILEDIPIVNIVLNLYFPFWVMLFTICYGLYKHRKRIVYSIMPLMLMWMTFLLGPTSNFRYMFPFVICYPIIFSLIFNSNKLIKND